MPDLGIDVLLKGQNFIRLLAGLGAADQYDIGSDQCSFWNCTGSIDDLEQSVYKSNFKNLS